MGKRTLTVTGSLLAMLLLTAMALTASMADFDLWLHVIAGGGGRSSSASYVVSGSIGQPAVGGLSGGNYRLDAGFWPGIGAEAPAQPTSTSTPTPTATATGPAPPTSTPTATPTSTVPHTPTPTATVTGTPPVPCANTLAHGDFEAGLLPPWGSVGGTQVTTARAHGGTRSVRLGGTDNAADELFAGVELPSAATSITLSYWWYVESTDPNPNADIMVVVVGEEGHETLVETLTNGSPRDAWHQSTFDLGSHAGQMVGMIFHAETDAANPTSFYLDDVQVQVCGAAPPGGHVYLPLVMK